MLCQTWKWAILGLLAQSLVATAGPSWKDGYGPHYVGEPHAWDKRQSGPEAALYDPEGVRSLFENLPWYSAKFHPSYQKHDHQDDSLSENP
ncbi:hypothetical protein MMC10_007211 [Thelotrema lepadinum]|nr:hypothetical protein [Thelotrema lepadinum]